MTIVKIKNSLLLILVLFVSCKSSIKEKKSIENENSKIEKKTLKKYDYSNIQTNSLKDDFIGELIDTLPVKKGDTILFRKWDTGKTDSIFFKDKSVIYKLKRSAFVNYYKTGENKFSTYELSIENTKNKERFDFNTIVNYDIHTNPYSLNNISGYIDLESVSKNKGKFIIADSNAEENFILFQIENKSLQITKLKRSPLRTKLSPYWYELDTLITINKKNNLINLTELQGDLMKEKNTKE